MKNFKKWARFLPFLPLLALLILVNIYGDAGNRFESPAKFVAEAILQGKASYVASDNFDDMEMRYRLIPKMPDELECVVVGQSNVAAINHNDVGTASFINLTGTCDFYGLMSVFGLMKIYDKRAKRIIIGPMEWIFNERAGAEKYELIKSLKPYADYMIDFLNGKNYDSEDYKNKIAPPEFMSTLEKLLLIFSLSYFQSNSEFLTLNSAQPVQRYGYLDGKFSYEGGYIMSDGSRVPSKRTLGHDERYVVRSALERSSLSSFAPGEHVTPERMELFEKLVKYLTARGVKVDLFLHSFAPALWDLYDENLRPFIPELEEYCHTLEKKYSVRVIGSFNPYKVGITNKEFWDARHIKNEYMSKFFNFKQ